MLHAFSISYCFLLVLKTFIAVYYQTSVMKYVELLSLSNQFLLVCQIFRQVLVIESLELDRTSEGHLVPLLQ